MGIAQVLDRRLSLAQDEAAPVFGASLAPLLAGARARGMADAFDLLGLGAVLLDDDGAALHVSEQAWRLFGPDLSVSRGRLKAVDAASDVLLQAGVNATLIGREDGAASIVLMRGEGQPSLRLRIVAVTAENESAQLLKAVVLIDCVGGPSKQEMESMA